MSNFGAVVTTEGEIMIEVSSTALRAGRISHDDFASEPRVLVMLRGQSQYSPPGHPIYLVTAVERLD